MNYRVILSVLFVTLSWRFMGTSAQSNVTVNSNTVSTVGGTNPTSIPTTTTTVGPAAATNPPSTTTTTVGAAAATNPTSTTTTTVVAAGANNPSSTTTTTVGAAAATNPTSTTTTTVGAAGAINPTSTTTTTVGAAAATNPTSTTTTTVGAAGATNPSSTTTTTTTVGAAGAINPTSTTTTVGAAGATHPTSTTTTVGATGPTNLTSTTITTTVGPPLVENDTVVALNTSISRSGCGSQRLCAAQPATCDPSGPVPCFFLAAKQINQNYEFDLAGESDGYIAATVSTGSTVGDTTYICAKSKGAVKFFGAILKNGKLIKSGVNANSVKGTIKGKQIQCTFLATIPPPKTKATDVGLSVSSGAYNDTNDDLGDPSPVIKSAAVNLADPNATVTNEITFNTTTTAPTTGTLGGGNATITGTLGGSPATAGGNNTTVTPAGNTTTAAGTTTIPATTITRRGCGSTKLCAAEPSACDPSTGDQCYFISAKQQSGQLYNFELSGQSNGYVAAGLSTGTDQAGSYQTYVCANKNGVVKFYTGIIKNHVLNSTPLNASIVNGAVSSSKIQCTFGATLPDTTRAAGYSMLVSTGSYSASSEEFGPPTFRIQTPVVNLSDSNSTTTNLINSTNSTSGAYPVAHQQSLMMPALLLIVTILVFTTQ